MPAVTLPGPLADESFRQWTTNRGNWVASIENAEPVLALPDNRTSDWLHGTVAIAGEPTWRNYEFSLELRVLSPPDTNAAGAWPGVIFRAQDTENYELVWFMPSGPEDAHNVAYLPVAHGLVPWWADAYVHNPRGSAPYQRDEWLLIKVRVQGLEASVFTGGNGHPILQVRLTYYLIGGLVGVYCGTQTSAKFRRFKIRHLEPAPIPDPPTTATPRFGHNINA